jgi:hypothetical protein
MGGMDRFNEFLCYPFAVLRWTFAAWWHIFKENLIWSTLIGAAAFLASVYIHREAVDYWPEVQEFLSDPVDQVVGFIFYGIFGMGCVYAASLVFLLVVAPSQIYYEQKKRIQELLPPLQLAFTPGQSGATARDIQLNNISLTNRSQQNMSLNFVMRVRFVKD